jgi:tetratricopeptide (TPR) repeat protein
MADPLKIDTDPVQTWDRVASELRAYRAAQQQAWGDVDNATLGRYLAGEIDGEERQQVEEALAAFPELHRLTTLVQDVLGEAEPATSASSPAVLSLAEFRSQKPPRSRVHRWAPRLALLAAACVMLALGLNLAEPGHELLRSRKAPAGAERAVALVPSGEEGFSPMSGPRFVVRAKPGLTAKAPSEVPPARQPERALLKTAKSLNNAGQVYKEQGELARAEQSFSQAHLICRDTLGPDDRRTAEARNNLADVYTAALNTVAATEDQVVATWGPTAGSFSSPERPVPPNPLPGAGRGHPLRGGPNPYRLTPGENHFRILVKSRGGQNASLQAAWQVYADIASQKTDRVQASVLPVLVHALRDAPGPREKARLARAIGRLGPAARVAVPTLAACLHDAHSDEERRALLFALGQVGLGADLPRARRAVPEVLNSLNSECPQARQLAAQVLVQVAPEARKQIYAVALRKETDARALDQILREAREHPRWVGVRDPEHCFTVHTLCEAQKQINRLVQDHDVKVQVETVPARDLNKPAASAHLEGKRLHILIAQDGSDVRVACCPTLEKRGLRPEHLRQILQENVRKKAFDPGLLQGLQYLTRAVTE